MPKQYCTATKKNGTPCRIYFGLDASQRCKFHVYQHLKVCCRGIKADGTRCEISWDLDASQRCENHAETSRVVAQVGGVREDTEARRVRVLSNERSTPSTTSTPSTPSPTRSNVLSPADQGEADVTACEKLPPLWTAQYIPSTGTVVLRMYCESSWRCHHAPIVLRVPWWSQLDSTIARGIVTLGGLLPYIGDLVSTGGSAALGRIDATDYLMDVLEEMGIYKGGLYCSVQYMGRCDDDDQELLRCLMDRQEPGRTKDRRAGASELKPVADSKSGAVIWVAKSVPSKSQLSGITQVLRSTRPAPTAMLLFARVVDRLPRLTRHGSTTIHWQLRLSRSVGQEPLECGVACVGEPVPVLRVTRSQLAHCVLHLQLRKKRRDRGNGSIALAGVPIDDGEGDNNGRGSKDEADTAAVRHIRVSSGRVVHFRMLEPSK